MSEPEKDRASESQSLSLDGIRKQFSANQHTADLGRARTDFIQLGIPQESSGWVIIDITVAAE